MGFLINMFLALCIIGTFSLHFFLFSDLFFYQNFLMYFVIVFHKLTVNENEAVKERHAVHSIGCAVLKSHISSNFYFMHSIVFITRICICTYMAIITVI